MKTSSESLSVSVYTTASETSGITRAQGHDLNKLGRGSLSDATYQISRLYAFLKFSS